MGSLSLVPMPFGLGMRLGVTVKFSVCYWYNLYSLLT